MAARVGQRSTPRSVNHSRDVKDLRERVALELFRRVISSLFQGLVHLRRVDPANVPDDLFAQALRWLFAGMRST
jgi:hypothetical protein